MKRIFVAIGVLMLICADVQATVRVDAYLHPAKPDFKDLNRVVLSGIVDGFQAYSVILQSNKMTRLFCPPDKLTITTDQADDILRRWIEKQTVKPDSLPIALALLIALQEVFPCN